MTFVFAVVCPDFFAEAMLQVIFPLSFVSRAILMNVDSVTVGFVVKPFSLKDITVYMPKLSVSACLVEPPVTFILGAILPNLLAVPMLHVSEPLSNVSSTVFKMDLTSIFELGLVDIIKINSVSGEVASIVENISSSVAHVVLVLRIHFA